MTIRLFGVLAWCLAVAAGCADEPGDNPGTPPDASPPPVRLPDGGFGRWVGPTWFPPPSTADACEGVTLEGSTLFFPARGERAEALGIHSFEVHAPTAPRDTVDRDEWLDGFVIGHTTRGPTYLLETSLSLPRLREALEEHRATGLRFESSEAMAFGRSESLANLVRGPSFEDYGDDGVHVGSYLGTPARGAGTYVSSNLELEIDASGPEALASSGLQVRLVRRGATSRTHDVARPDVEVELMLSCETATCRTRGGAEVGEDLEPVVIPAWSEVEPSIERTITLAGEWTAGTVVIELEFDPSTDWNGARLWLSHEGVSRELETYPPSSGEVGSWVATESGIRLSVTDFYDTTAAGTWTLRIENGDDVERTLRAWRVITRPRLVVSYELDADDLALGVVVPDEPAGFQPFYLAADYPEETPSAILRRAELALESARASRYDEETGAPRGMDAETLADLLIAYVESTPHLDCARGLVPVLDSTPDTNASVCRDELEDVRAGILATYFAHSVEPVCVVATRWRVMDDAVRRGVEMACGALEGAWDEWSVEDYWADFLYDALRRLDCCRGINRPAEGLTGCTCMERYPDRPNLHVYRHSIREVLEMGGLEQYVCSACPQVSDRVTRSPECGGPPAIPEPPPPEDPEARSASFWAPRRVTGWFSQADRSEFRPGGNYDSGFWGRDRIVFPGLTSPLAYGVGRYSRRDESGGFTHYNDFFTRDSTWTGVGLIFNTLEPNEARLPPSPATIDIGVYLRQDVVPRRMTFSFNNGLGCELLLEAGPDEETSQTCVDDAGQSVCVNHPPGLAMRIVSEDDAGSESGAIVTLTFGPMVAEFSCSLDAAVQRPNPTPEPCELGTRTLDHDPEHAAPLGQMTDGVCSCPADGPGLNSAGECGCDPGLEWDPTLHRCAPELDCFGAVGRGCIPLQEDPRFPRVFGLGRCEEGHLGPAPQVGGVSTCVSDPHFRPLPDGQYQSVSIGSLTHDECCRLHPDGFFCGEGSNFTNTCMWEFARAGRDVLEPGAAWRVRFTETPLEARHVMTGGHAPRSVPRTTAIAPNMIFPGIEVPRSAGDRYQLSSYGRLLRAPAGAYVGRQWAGEHISADFATTWVCRSGQMTDWGLCTPEDSVVWQPDWPGLSCGRVNQEDLEADGYPYYTEVHNFVRAHHEEAQLGSIPSLTRSYDEVTEYILDAIARGEQDDAVEVRVAPPNPSDPSVLWRFYDGYQASLGAGYGGGSPLFLRNTEMQRPNDVWALWGPEGQISALAVLRDGERTTSSKLNDVTFIAGDTSTDVAALVECLSSRLNTASTVRQRRGVVPGFPDGLQQGLVLRPRTEATSRWFARLPASYNGRGEWRDGVPRPMDFMQFTHSVPVLDPDYGPADWAIWEGGGTHRNPLQMEERSPDDFPFMPLVVSGCSWLNEHIANEYMESFSESYPSDQGSFPTDDPRLWALVWYAEAYCNGIGESLGRFPVFLYVAEEEDYAALNVIPGSNWSQHLNDAYLEGAQDGRSDLRFASAPCSWGTHHGWETVPGTNQVTGRRNTVTYGEIRQFMRYDQGGHYVFEVESPPLRVDAQLSSDGRRLAPAREEYLRAHYVDGERPSEEQRRIDECLDAAGTDPELAGDPPEAEYPAALEAFPTTPSDLYLDVMR